MGQITLNKPSGGQLTLSPEDGTSNETVTIPAAGSLIGDTGHFFYAVAGANLTSSHDSWTKIDTLTNIIADPKGEFTNSRYTPSKAGWYEIHARFMGESIVTGAGTIGYVGNIYKNGVGSVIQTLTTSNPDGAHEDAALGGMLYLNGTTDYIEFWIYHNDSYLKTIYGSWTSFQAKWIGE